MGNIIDPISGLEITLEDESKINELVGLLTNLDITIRQKGIFRVMNKGVLERIATERALQLLTGKNEIVYYKANSKPNKEFGEAYAEIIALAKEGKLFDDIARTQWLFEAVDKELQGGTLANELFGLVDSRTMAAFQMLVCRFSLARNHRV
jgi:hypothetical protein